MKMKKENVVGLAAILVGCGVAIGALAAKIYYDKNKEYFDEVKRIKKETSIKLSKEFWKALREELKESKAANEAFVVAEDVLANEVVADEPIETPDAKEDESETDAAESVNEDAQNLVFE